MKTQAAVIEFGTSKIVTLLAESGGFSRCEIIGSGTVPYDGYSDGDWNAPESIAQAIRKSVTAAEIEAKTKISELYVGVPCDYIKVLTKEVSVAVTGADSRVCDNDIDSLQDAAADQLDLTRVGMVLHRSPAWFQVDSGKKTMSPAGLRGETLTGLISFIVADPAFVSDIHELMGTLGIMVLGFLSPSLGEELLLLTLEDRDRVAAFVDVGYLNTEFSVVEGDAMVYHAVLPLGGGQIAGDLASQLNITLDSAETIKRSYIFRPDEFDVIGDPEAIDVDGQRLILPLKVVTDVIEGTAGDLCDMIAGCIKDASGLMGPRSQIFLTGGGLSLVRGGKEFLADALGRPVKVPMVKAAKMNSPIYASAMGLVDLVFDSIEQRSADDNNIPGRLAGGLRGLFTRK